MDSSFNGTVEFVEDLAASSPLGVPLPEDSAGLIVRLAVLGPGDVAETNIVARVVGLGTGANVKSGGFCAVNSILLVVVAGFSLKVDVPGKAVLLHSRNVHDALGH